MTPSEAKTELETFKKEIGPRADVFLSINQHGDTALDCSVYPDGVTGNCAFRVYADDWPELLIRARTKWAEFADTHQSRRIREMALKIIAITADKGECSDSDLRSADFSDDDIKRYGDAAVTDADRIASNGPFKIKRRRGVNAAA